MDAIDRKILAVVQEDVSLSVAEIGQRVGQPEGGGRDGSHEVEDGGGAPHIQCGVARP